MKAYYGLPSGTYTITLSKDDLEKLIATGRINIFTHDIPCVTGRAIYDSENDIMQSLDRKNVPNDLRFHLRDNVADLKGGESVIQFLNIRIE